MEVNRSKQCSFLKKEEWLASTLEENDAAWSELSMLESSAMKNRIFSCERKKWVPHQNVLEMGWVPKRMTLDRFKLVWQRAAPWRMRLFLWEKKVGSTSAVIRTGLSRNEGWCRNLRVKHWNTGSLFERNG